MTDPVSAIEDIVAPAATSFLSSFGIYIAAGLIAVALGLGWYAHGVYYGYEDDAKDKAMIAAQATQITNYQTQLAKLQKLNYDNDAAHQREIAEIKAQAAQDKINGTKYAKQISPSGSLSDDGLRYINTVIARVNAELATFRKSDGGM